VVKGWVVMKKTLILFFLFALPLTCYAQNNGASVGYGFGFLNIHERIGKVERHQNYNFVPFAYFHEFHLIKDLFFHVEPYLAYINQPNNGVDVGLNLLLRYYVNFEKSSLFVDLGSGGAYTSIAFKGQNTHGLFILQGGIGYKWKKFFIEDRFRHYSNASLSYPNHSVNANIISIGMYF
jgi:hypothetical protein